MESTPVLLKAALIHLQHDVHSCVLPVSEQPAFTLASMGLYQDMLCCLCGVHVVKFYLRLLHAGARS